MKLIIISIYLLFITSIVSFSQNSDFIRPLRQISSSEFKLEIEDSISILLPKVGNTQIKLSKVSNWGDPGDFHLVEIINSKYSKSFSNLDGWVKFNQNYPVNDELKNMNQTNTDLFLVASNENQSLLILFGWVYASDPGLCTVIDLNNGTIVYNQNSELTSISLQKGTLTFSEKLTVECYGYTK
ncbi:MAG: hypothetical protein RLO12_23375 [Fulvivirga sp.]